MAMDLRVIYTMAMDLRVIYMYTMAMRPTGHIYNGNGPSGHIYMYNGNETFESDTMESRADVRLDLSQNNKLNSVAYAYVHEIVSNNLLVIVIYIA